MKLTERKIEKLAAERGRKDRLVFDDCATRTCRARDRERRPDLSLPIHAARAQMARAARRLFGGRARQSARSRCGRHGRRCEGKEPGAERKDAAAAERARRTRNRLTLRVLIEDWNRLHLAGKRPSYAAEAVRALHYAFADHLDDAAEDLDRAAVVRALDGLTRRRKRKDGDGADKPKGAAMTGRTAAYGRAAFAWAVKRGAVRANPFAALPIDKSIGKRERVLSDQEIAEIWQRRWPCRSALRHDHPTVAD